MKEIVVKYTKYILALAVILFFVLKCVNSTADKYTGEGNVYEKQLKNRVEILKKKAEAAKKEIDSLHSYNKERDSIILGLKKSNDKLIEKIAYIGKAKDSAIKKAASFSHKESAYFIGQKLNIPNSVSADSSGVILKNDAPNKVAEVIIEKEACEEENIFTKQLISNSELEKVELNKKLVSKDKEIQTINDLSKEKDLTLEAANQNIDSFKKQIKTLKTSRTIERIIIVGIAGFLILK